MEKRLKPVELFLALGLVATVSACGGATAPESDANTEVDTAPTTEASPEEPTTDEGGEGGEGGEG